MAYPVTFVPGQILEAAELNDNFNYAYTGYTSYTPTMGGWTQGNATFDGKYAVNGETVHYYGVLTFGSTSAVTASALTLTLPVTAVASPDSLGICSWNDISGGGAIAGTVKNTTTTALDFYWHDPEAAPIAVRLESWTTGVTLPFTFATGDFIFWDIQYRKA